MATPPRQMATPPRRGQPTDVPPEAVPRSKRTGPPDRGIAGQIAIANGGTALRPDDVWVYVAPGMNMRTFAELLEGAGIVTGVNERFEEYNTRFGDLDALVEGIRNDLQQQINHLSQRIDELHGPEAAARPLPHAATRPAAVAPAAGRPAVPARPPRR